MNYVIYQSFSWMMPLPIRIIGKSHHLWHKLTIDYHPKQIWILRDYHFWHASNLYKERNQGRTAIMFIAYI